MQRLFNRGHREEARFIEWLRGIGFEVWDVTDSGEQHRVKAVRGHFGGSLDGINRAPERYRITEPMLCEFKTNGTGSGFTKLKEQGVAVAKPKHFAQMSIYGRSYGFKYALYLCINKNDDDIYVEIVELDWRLADDLLRKADEIISAEIAPPKIAFNEAFFECKYCAFVGICHRGDAPERNCRSCINAKAVDNGEWFCQVYGSNIPSDFISKTCDSYRAIE